MADILDDLALARDAEAKASRGKKMFERLGGRPALDKVHKIFYDKIYAHPWIGQYFKGINQRHIESQQSDFMAMLFGGPKDFGGRMPIFAHEHMMITEELFAVRRQLLEESLREAGIAEQEAHDWLAIDGAFKKALVKKSLDECKKRFVTDEILAFPPPPGFKQAS